MPATALTYGLLGGGVLAAGGAAALAAWWALDKSSKHVDEVKQAVISGGTVKIHTTGYWPFTARTDELKMEGGPEGAAVWRGKKAIDPGTGKRPYLHTLEQHLKDPQKYPYVSLSGDPSVWPWGQRIIISAWPNAVFRFVDTGSHFTGLKKTYRVVGEEPVDVCVDSSKTSVPKKNVTAQIVRGDNWAGGAEITASNLRDQTVVGLEWLGGAVIGAVDAADAEALARAIESCRPSGTLGEKQAVAWACRNRATKLGVPVARMLVPEGMYGPRGACGRDFASTAIAARGESKAVAKAVLSLPQSADPTVGAVDFWCPSQQERLKVLGDVRAALVGAEPTMPSVDEVRAAHLLVGLRPAMTVGAIELLRAA